MLSILARLAAEGLLSLPTLTLSLSVVLAADQVTTMAEKPVVLVGGAPDQMLIPNTISLRVTNPNGDPFGEGGDIQIGSEGLISTLTDSAAVVTTPNPSGSYVGGIATTGAANLRGLPLIITNVRSPFKGGPNCTLTVMVTYTVLTDPINVKTVGLLAQTGKLAAPLARVAVAPQTGAAAAPPAGKAQDEKQ